MNLIYRYSATWRALCIAMLLVSTCSITMADGQPDQTGSSSTPASQAAANQAGVVTSVDGDVLLTQGSLAPRPAKVGDAINEGDLLVSGANSELQIRMQDSGFMVLRPNTVFKVVSYKADGGDDDTGIFQLVKGGFRSISGWIGKYNARRYLINTPTATIGIRGTDHEPHVIPEGSDEGEPGTYDRVYSGQTYLDSGNGQTALTPDQAGFASSKAHSRPQLLGAIPGFFKPGPHEAEINQKHQEIEQQIDNKRQERRKLLEQDRAALAAARQQTQQLRQNNKAEQQQQQQTIEQEREQMKQKREALKADFEANQQLLQSLRDKRAALQADVQAGNVSKPELKQRRQELQEQFKQARDAQEALKQRRTELEQEADANVDQNYEAAEQRLQALHDQQLKTRAQRNDLDQDRDSTQEEIRTQQQQENKRYINELKADRKNGNVQTPDAGSAPSDTSPDQGE